MRPSRSPDNGKTSGEDTQQLLGDLQRYAGWLGKDVRSSRLRASVKNLGLAIGSGRAVPDAVLSVQADIEHLGPGAIVPLLRGTMRKITVELVGRAT